MTSETPEQQIERILSLRLDLDTHKNMYQKFGHEIWDLAKVCELWQVEDISNSRMRELIGIYLWNSRQELLKEIIGEIEKHRSNFRAGFTPGYLNEETRGYKWALEEVLNILNNKLKEQDNGK